ncbi:hypothetical protein KP77_08170 [Jeotgalibacillus alimentarius]|uniref:Uncharacterized protein n=1 Tax=Jeotgalibacillus alimentarius TaxID=135826 RepID=A0A0C2W3W5_9BACL|nr:hypothetical protein KP77_08170 [Jeotgalibacillus alimentarius]
MHQITAHRMTPMHRSPLRRKWMVLIKQVIFPIKIRKTIRVIHPIRPRRHVKPRIPLVRLHPWLHLLNRRLRNLNLLLHLVTCFRIVKCILAFSGMVVGNWGLWGVRSSTSDVRHITHGVRRLA